MLSNYKYFITFCFIVVCTQLVFSFTLFGQRANNWYFPTKKSLTFNTTPPSFIGNSKCEESGAASISDNNGFLLFYSDGKRVFNRNHQIMPNGNNLNGGIAPNNGITGNRALIVPHPGIQNLYYLFTNESNQGILPTGYYYHLIDINANGGLGDVVLKNQLLYSNSGMRMTAAPMADGVGYWLITMEYRKKILRNYKITCLGINSTPVIDTIDANFIGNSSFDIGDMKASTSGNLLTCGYAQEFGNGTTELYTFNRTTGKTTNKLIIPLLSLDREFSSSDKFLYFGAASNQSLYQFDISSFDSTTIFNNRNIIGQGIGSQLGPDGRIYVLNDLDTLFSYIDKPNLLFPSCNFVSRVIPIESNGINGTNGTFRRILPFFVPSLLANQNVQINYTVANDCRTVTLTGKTFIKGNNLLFKWKFGDGDSLLQLVTSQGDTTFNTVTHFYPPGVDTFFASLTVTSDTVCGQGSAGKPIVVKPPKPKANFGVATQCNSLAVQFTDSSLLNFNPSISYNWQFGNGQTSNLANNGAIVFPTYGNYSASLIVTSSFSCVESDTLVKNFSLFQNPTATFTIANANCINNPVLLNSTTAINNKDSIATYFWQNGTSVSATNNNTSSFNFTSGGNKTVQHWVITQNGCKSDTATQTFFLETTPQVNFSNTKACVNEPIFFTNNSSNTFGNITQLTWSLDNNTTAFGNVVNNTYANFGNYTIQLKASTAKGCVDSIRKTITISPIVANAGNDTAVFANQPFLLNGSGGNNYNWQPAFLVNNNQTANPIIRLQQSQTFILTVSNNEQCTDTDSIFVKVLKPIEIPNAFSPNGDGINDVWVIKNLSDYSNAQLQIFNRYGQMVFSSTNYQNNFNGTFNGKPLPIATYYYVLTVKGNGFSLPIFKGGITLLR